MAVVEQAKALAAAQALAAKAAKARAEAERAAREAAEAEEAAMLEAEQEFPTVRAAEAIRQEEESRQRQVDRFAPRFSSTPSTAILRRPAQQQTRRSDEPPERRSWQASRGGDDRPPRGGMPDFGEQRNSGPREDEVLTWRRAPDPDEPPPPPPRPREFTPAPTPSRPAWTRREAPPAPPPPRDDWPSREDRPANDERDFAAARDEQPPPREERPLRESEEGFVPQATRAWGELRTSAAAPPALAPAPPPRTPAWQDGGGSARGPSRSSMSFAQIQAQEAGVNEARQKLERLVGMVCCRRRSPAFRSRTALARDCTDSDLTWAVAWLDLT